jgi:hemoglobin-like flavoprotein
MKRTERVLLHALVGRFSLIVGAMLSDEEKGLIRNGWKLLEPIADTAVDLFCRRLFDRRPDYRVLFAEDLAAPKKQLVTTLGFIVKALDWPASEWRAEVAEADDLLLALVALGRRHAELQGVADERYDAVGEALIWTLDYAIGEPFDANARAAWTRLWGLIATALRMGRAMGPERASERPAQRASERPASGTRPARSNRPAPAGKRGAVS